MRNGLEFKEYFKKPSYFDYLGARFSRLFSRPLPPLTEKGTHFISGFPGSGKTLLMNHIIRETELKKYYYLSNMKEFKNVKSFDLDSLFKDNKQVERLPVKLKNKRLFGVIFDEINLTFNKRINRNKDYNNIFIGLIEFLVSSRHQGIDRVYFIGQRLDLQDNQLISLFKYHHEIIKTKRRYKFFLYHNKKILVKIPVKLKLMNYIKIENNEFMAIGKSKIKLNRQDLETYVTDALKNNYKDLKIVDLK